VSEQFVSAVDQMDVQRRPPAQRYKTSGASIK
jgi:hypothetical protein